MRKETKMEEYGQSAKKHEFPLKNSKPSENMLPNGDKNRGPFQTNKKQRICHQQKPRPSGRKGFLGGNKWVQEQVRSTREGDCGVTQDQNGDRTLVIPWGSVQNRTEPHTDSMSGRWDKGDRSV